ncbi:MAG: PmoA family protein [Bacteroidales bacterium]
MKPNNHFTIFLMILFPFASCTQSPPSPTLVSDESSATIMLGEQPLLTYVNSETPAPGGQNPLYKRSAYIHPLRSPGGEILTRIQPEDHYHHYGIWNPWTHTHFGEDTVDFWNLALGQGTVRFAGYLDQYERRGEAGFRVRHDHIYFKKEGGEGVAINETWNLRVHDAGENVYTADLTVTLSTPLEVPVTLEEYRYGGGIGFRATEKWGTGNSTVLTSEGKTRAGADGTGARWVIVEGESSVPQGRSGILFLSHPENRAHPEPMRMWPPEQNDGLSNVFFEFCPIRHQEWVLEPGKAYTLKYRMVVFDGVMDVETAEKHWKQFQ